MSPVDAAAALALVVKSKPFNELAQKLSDSVVSGVSRQAKHIYETLTANFQPHLEATYRRCTKLKTLLNREEPADLLSLYVDLKFTCERKAYSDYDVIDEIRKRRKVIISGTGGSGKSVFMKYLWLTFFENSEGRIPIFVELRNLNELSSDDLITYIFRSIVNTNSNVAPQVFVDGIKDGKFVFMLDGLDEIAISKREELEKQILSLANDNPKCILVISTRPDEKVQSWQTFSIFTVCPLEKSQTTALLKKINYDPKIKSKFINRVSKDLYDKHKSFLSSPLLTTMMLLTFDQFAEIPEKIHLFYEQAFDTLFAKHDALKEAYKRKMYTGFPIDVFKKYFSLFCLVSYYEQHFEFSEQEILSDIAKGLKIENVAIDTNAFLKDLMESVCIIQRDGLKFVFSHRSFQEFFAAYCLTRMPRKYVAKLLPKFVKRPADNVVPMLFDMNEELVESEYVVPELQGLLVRLQEVPDERRLEQYFKLMSITTYIEAQKNRLFYTGGELEKFVYLLRRIYRSHFKNNDNEHINALHKVDQRVLQQNLVLDSLPSGTMKGFQKSGELSIGVRTGKNGVPRFAQEGGITRLKTVKWIRETGFAIYKRQEMENLFSLQVLIESKRSKRTESIDTVFGLTA